MFPVYTVSLVLIYSHDCQMSSVNVFKLVHGQSLFYISALLAQFKGICVILVNTLCKLVQRNHFFVPPP